MVDWLLTLLNLGTGFLEFLILWWQLPGHVVYWVKVLHALLKLIVLPTVQAYVQRKRAVDRQKVTLTGPRRKGVNRKRPHRTKRRQGQAK